MQAAAAVDETRARHQQRSIHESLTSKIREQQRHLDESKQVPAEDIAAKREKDIERLVQARLGEYCVCVFVCVCVCEEESEGYREACAGPIG
jgi:hypothetical protein